jgi:hypothetical protein
MKKITGLILLILFMLHGIATAGVNEKYWLLQDATATGPDTEEYVIERAYHMWVCDVFLTGSPTAVTVRVEGSAGATQYDTLGLAEHEMTAAQLAAGFGSFQIVQQKAKRLRGNLVILAGGTSPTVSMGCVGGE